MKESILLIRTEIEAVCDIWKDTKKINYEQIVEIINKIKEILEVLVNYGIRIDICAGDAIVDLVENLIEGLQYKDNILLIDTLKYGWLPYFDLVQKIEEE